MTPKTPFPFEARRAKGNDSHLRQPDFSVQTVRAYATAEMARGERLLVRAAHEHKNADA